MQSGFTDKETYHMEFDPREYMKTYFSAESGLMRDDNYMKFVLTNLHKIFSSGDVKGHTLIDIGCGPCIYQIMSACESFEDIIATDLCEKNRAEYRRWLKNHTGSFDWSPMGKMVCELEGNRQTWTEKEKKIRTAVKQVLKCDVTQHNPLDPIVLPQADCLISSLCLESACKDLDTYCRVVKNITTLLKTGGHFVLCGVLGCSAWMVGEKVFSGLPHDEKFIRTTLSKTGYVIKEFAVEPMAEKCNKTICDYDANFVLLAQKEKDV